MNEWVQSVVGMHW